MHNVYHVWGIFNWRKYVSKAFTDTKRKIIRMRKDFQSADKFEGDMISVFYMSSKPYVKLLFSFKVIKVVAILPAKKYPRFYAFLALKHY